MDVLVVTIVRARAKGAGTYSKITFIVSSDAQELLVSFKDQVTLWILPASYPYYLGDTEGQVAKFTEEENIVTPYNEEPDQEAQIVYRMFAKFLEHQADSFIPGDKLEEKELIQDLHDEEEDMIKSKSSLEQKLIREYRDCFSQTLTRNQSFKTEQMKIMMDHTKEKAKNAYNFRPRAIPENIREKARQMIEGMMRAGAIKRATGPSHPICTGQSLLQI